MQPQRPAAPSARLDVGDVLDGRYHLIRDIGRGAGGAVFEARHLFTGRFVAVKVVLPFAHAASLPELRARLQREGQALASIRHPGVVDILDGAIAQDGSPYIVMEMLGGRTLEGLVAARGRLSVADAVGVALQLCDALAAVHRAGVVHRDVKPSNVVVIREPDGLERAKLVDFGIARVQQSSEEKLTGIGAVIGTPAYMSPEQLLAVEEVDLTSDIYSLGITMFECLSGAVPYPGPYGKVLLRVAGQEPPPTLRSMAPDVPVGLAAVVDRAIARERTARFASAEDFARAIRQAAPSVAARTSLLGPPPLPNDTRVQARRTPRAPYKTPVRLTMKEGILDGRTEDISEGGALVLSHAACAPNQRVGMRFALPMEGTVVGVDAEVRWIRAAQGPDIAGMRAIGVEFVTLPNTVRESIARYVGLMSDRV